MGIKAASCIELLAPFCLNIVYLVKALSLSIDSSTGPEVNIVILDTYQAISVIKSHKGCFCRLRLLLEVIVLHLCKWSSGKGKTRMVHVAFCWQVLLSLSWGTDLSDCKVFERLIQPLIVVFLIFKTTWPAIWSRSVSLLRFKCLDSSFVLFQLSWL